MSLNKCWMDVMSFHVLFVIKPLSIRSSKVKKIENWLLDKRSIRNGLPPYSMILMYVAELRFCLFQYMQVFAYLGIFTQKLLLSANTQAIIAMRTKITERKRISGLLKRKWYFPLFLCTSLRGGRFNMSISSKLSFDCSFNLSFGCSL